MGASGAIIMSFFGAMFATMSLALPMYLHGAVLGLPFLGSVAIAVAALLVLRLPGHGVVRSRHAGRVIMWSTIGEGAELFAAASLVLNFGSIDLLIPSVATVVGLHFMPMAWGIPFPPFYATGFALLLSALIGFLVTQPLGGEVTGFAAAALVVSSIIAIERDRRMRLR